MEQRKLYYFGFERQDRKCIIGELPYGIRTEVGDYLLEYPSPNVPGAGMYRKVSEAEFIGRTQELKMSDPLLAEIASQICSTGICLAGSKKKSRLPICTASQKRDRESCIRQLKPRQEAGEIKSAFAVCTARLGCRPGRRKERAK